MGQFQGKVFGYHACGTPELTDHRCQQLLNGGGNNNNNNCGSWNNYCNGNNNNNNNNCCSWNNYCNGNNNNNNNCGSWNNYCGRRKGGSTRKGSKVTSTRGQSSKKTGVSFVPAK